MDLYLIVLCAALQLRVATTNGLLGLKEGESCEGLGGVKGSCRLMSKCEYPGDVRTDHPPICSFKVREPVICCPVSLSERIHLAGLKINQYCTQAESACVERRNIQLAKGRNEISRHVIGGEESKGKTHIHMALIGYGFEKEKEWGCGGSLINSRFVLSAAHCAKPELLGEAKWARLGELDTSSETDDANVQDRAIIEAILHPGYKEPKVYNDIALFRMDREVEFTPWVAPACLYIEDTFDFPTATVTGWGRVDFAGPVSEKLLEAVINIFSDTDCRKLYPSKNNKTPKGIISKLMFCAGIRDGSKDACSGDSGGPLVISNPGHCLKTQIGITSYGNQCGLPDSPGVYTRVSNYISWIEAKAFAEDDELIFHDFS